MNADDAIDEADSPAVLPRFAEIRDQFSKLENNLYDSDVLDAVYFLHKAKIALSAMKKKSEPAHGEQLLMWETLK